VPVRPACAKLKTPLACSRARASRMVRAETLIWWLLAGLGEPAIAAAIAPERYFEAVRGSSTLVPSKPVLAASSTTGSELVQVFFEKRSNNVLRATSLDGGQTWQAGGAAIGQANALVPLSVSCARGTGLCVAAWQDKATSAVETVLSKDSGVTWAAAPNVDAAAGGISGGVADIALSCLAKVDGKGLCILAVAGTGADGARAVAVYRGDNPAGGRAKWAFAASVGGSTATSPLALSCADEDSCVLVHGVSLGAGLRSAFSADQGRSWGSSSAMLASARATVAAAMPSAVALQCPTSARCIALVAWSAQGSSFIDFGASSGGASFARLVALSGDTLASSQPSLFCISGDKCMATYAAGNKMMLQVTADGGATFSLPRKGPVPDVGASLSPSVACDSSAGLCTVSMICTGTAVQAQLGVDSICVAISLPFIPITDPPVATPTTRPQTPSPSAPSAPAEPSAQPSSAQPPSVQPSSTQPPGPPTAPSVGSAVDGFDSSVAYIAAGVVLASCIACGFIIAVRKSRNSATETQVALKDDNRISIDVSDPGSKRPVETTSHPGGVRDSTVTVGDGIDRTTKTIPDDRSVAVSFRFTMPRMSQFILHKVSSRWDSKIW
jgi:hypothetical protein